MPEAEAAVKCAGGVDSQRRGHLPRASVCNRLGAGLPPANHYRIPSQQAGPDVARYRPPQPRGVPLQPSARREALG